MSPNKGNIIMYKIEWENGVVCNINGMWHGACVVLFLMFAVVEEYGFCFPNSVSC